MSDYISRQAAIEALAGWKISPIVLDPVPSADVRENVRGEWIEKHYTINCSVCKNCLWSGPYIDLVKKFNFCPNCGAEMGGNNNV